MGGADSRKGRKMKKEERRAYMRALHEKEHPERTYYTREEWLLRKAAEKSTAKEKDAGQDERKERIKVIQSDAFRALEELAALEYTVDELHWFISYLENMRQQLAGAALKRTAIADVLPEAVQESPWFFSSDNTESDECEKDTL